MHGYHIWGCSILFLEEPPQIGPTWIPKWEPSASNGVYIEQSPFHAVSVDLALKTRTRHVFSQYHGVFENTFSTVEHTRKGAFQGNWKTWQRNTQILIRRKNSLLQNGGILTNPQEWHCPGSPGNKTHCIQVPKIYLQGLIPRHHPVVRQKDMRQWGKK